MPESPAACQDATAPADLLPPGRLPPPRLRDLPEPVPLRRMIGPGVILAGLALGSGEYVLWPFITYQSGFVFIWAAVLGIVGQYFLNMEITRWTLATGESAITGFCRLSRCWAPVFLVLNVVPWMIPAWATGSAEIANWLGFDGAAPYLTSGSILGLIVCGLVLTAGPVVYETVEKVQLALVSLILLLVVALAVVFVRPDAIAAQLHGLAGFRVPPLGGELTAVVLLGALAFAGAGGTMNLGQSNYIRDKGYGMGQYVGRITSPLTGNAEPVVEIGYIFPPNEANLRRWRQWWRSASLEQFFSFLCTCLVCLLLLTLIAYSIWFDDQGQRQDGAGPQRQGMTFVWAQAERMAAATGPWARLAFLVSGMALLLTTEFGVLDVAARISTDIVKVNWLRDRPEWSEPRLYFLFLWGTILLGIVILLVGVKVVEGSFVLFKLTAALNGGVMALYSLALLWLNLRVLPRALRPRWWRAGVVGLAALFYGLFTVWAVVDTLGLG